MQRAAAGLDDQLDVGDQLRAVVPALEHDLAVVERLELGAVADADEGGGVELFGQQRHQLVLARRIERRGRLVEHDDVGLVQENAREGQPLLLAAGEDLVPGRVLLEAADEMRKADQLERPGNFLDAGLVRAAPDRSRPAASVPVGT